MDIGGYRTERLLGRGGSGRVWAATGPDGATVALKLLDGPSERSLRAARREVALAAQIDHPHLVAPRSVVCDADRVAVIAPLATGGSLADLLERRGTLTPAETLTVLIPLAAVLATAHERGVVHGDLSPSNVVLDGAGRPLVTDLGAARLSVECGLPVQATPSTVAPEVARGGVPDPAADVFAWGAVALQCLTGRPAWNALDLQDVVVQATVGQWPDPADDDGPAPLVAVIRAALGDVPARRPGAASVAVELRKCGEPAPLDLTAGAQDPGVAERAVPSSAGHVGAVGSVSRRRIRQLTRARHDAVPRPADAGSGAGEADRSDRRRRRRRRSAVALVAVAVVGLAVQGGLMWAGADVDEAGTPPPSTVIGARAPEAAQVSGTAPTPKIGATPSASGAAGAEPGLPAPTGAAPSVPTSSVPVPSSPGSTAPSSRPPAGVDWLDVVRGLDTGRADALVRRDPTALAAVYTADAAARAADAATITRLSEDGLRVNGAAHRITRATALRSGRSVLVTVTYSLPAYRVLDESGRVVGTTTPRRSTTRVLEVVEAGDGYRIAAVRAG